jgi:hypothetical protein
MLKQVQHDGRGQHKISCKGIEEKSRDFGGPFFVAIGAAVHRRYTIFRPRYVRVYAPCQAKGLAGRTRLSREHS